MAVGGSDSGFLGAVAAGVSLVALLASVPGAAGPAPVAKGQGEGWGVAREEDLREAVYRYVIPRARRKWPLVADYALDYGVGKSVRPPPRAMQDRLYLAGLPVRRKGAAGTSPRHGYVRLSGFTKLSPHDAAVRVDVHDVGMARHRVDFAEATVLASLSKAGWKIIGIKGDWRPGHHPRK
jgi:hypothetical protein